MIRTITPLFSIIVALVIFFFYAKPMFAEIQQTEGEVAQYNEAADKAAELNAELSRKLSEKRSYPVEVLERLDGLVPTSIDEIRILTDLNEIARSHSMLFGNVSVTDSDEELVKAEEPETKVVTFDELASASIDFSLIGTYEQFKSFLADLEQSLVMLEVTNIEFIAGENDLQQYAVSVQAFALPPIE